MAGSRRRQGRWSRHTAAPDSHRGRGRASEQAKHELAEIGPRPNDHRDAEVWAEEWRGAVILMAALADHDRAQLRLAATGEWGEPGARRLLLDAAQHCSDKH